MTGASNHTKTINRKRSFTSFQYMMTTMQLFCSKRLLGDSVRVMNDPITIFFLRKLLKEAAENAIQVGIWVTR